TDNFVEPRDALFFSPSSRRKVFGSLPQTKQGTNSRYRALRALAITVRVHCVCHRFKRRLVIEEKLCFRHDERTVGTHKLHGACDYSLRTFGVLAHNQNWLTQRRCLFLNSAGVGEDDSCTALELGELIIREWIGDNDIVQILNLRKNCLAHSWVEVQWQCKIGFRVCLR